jgi:hypothetical protein
VRRAIISFAVLTTLFGFGTDALAQINKPVPGLESPEAPVLPPIPQPPPRKAGEPVDEVRRGDTVTTRPRTDYDPIGARVGGFLFYSDLSVQESYNSNVFYTSSNTKGDWITAINPSLDLKSDWNQHALNFHADFDDVIYKRFSVNSFKDYTFGTDGRLDIQRDARAFAGFGYAVRHLPVYSPNNVPNTTSPIEYSDLSANLSGEKEFNRLSLRLDTNYDRYEYSNTPLAAGGFVQYSLNNYDEKRVALRTAYEFVPGRQVYLLTGGNFRDYDSSADINGFNRTSRGYTAAVGTKFDLTGVMFLDAFVGYRSQMYDDPRLKKLSGLATGAQLTWNVTRLTTVTGSVTRDIQETILAGASGYFATLLQVRADHELLRNLLLNVSAGYENDDFGSIGRTDNYYLAGTGAKFLINHNFWVSGGYNFAHRDSAQAGNFDDHIFFARISAHL